MEQGRRRTGLSSIPRNVWAASGCSFLTDISSEMVLNLLPLFLSNVLGATTVAIGVIEGMAETLSSLLKALSGWVSDRLRQRKGLALLGYALSAVGKPLLYFAASWGAVAVARWVDRAGKGVRTAPRDALLADSIEPGQRGLVFGLHRAADTAGAAVGLGVALLVVRSLQGTTGELAEGTFRTLALLSIVPAALGVLVLAVGAREPLAESSAQERPRVSLRGLGTPFLQLLGIVGVFELGNSADAFLVLRAQERGMSVAGVLVMLLCFNVVYALVSTPGGSLSDRVGRRPVIIAGWLVYAALYLGFALARTRWDIGVLYALYGVYYGLGFGTQRALVADTVNPEVRGTAYGAYNAMVGIMALPASVIAGALWQGIGRWRGLGPAAPFWFGSVMALVASVLLLLWRPKRPAADG